MSCLTDHSKQAIRRRDLLARIGGEEFARFCCPIPIEWGAINVAERVCAFLAASPRGTEAGTMNLTASIGVTSLRRSDPGPDAAMGRADQALYRAKEEGRNRVQASTRWALCHPSSPDPLGLQFVKYAGTADTWRSKLFRWGGQTLARPVSTRRARSSLISASRFRPPRNKF